VHQRRNVVGRRGRVDDLPAGRLTDRGTNEAPSPFPWERWRPREDLDDQGRVEQRVVVLVLQARLAAHDENVGIGVETGGGDVEP
jgi:hypothetical protein